MEVPGVRPRGRPRNARCETVKNDMKEMGVKREGAQERETWRMLIYEKTDQPG